MHYRNIDSYGIVHYADKLFYAHPPLYAFAAWCVLTQQRVRPPRSQCYPKAEPRNQAVTCLFCLHLRYGARNGR